MIWVIGLGLIVVLFLGTVIFGAPYVPSHTHEVERAFRRLYPLSPDDLVVDLGAGDGRILRIARSFGARAIGYELNPVLWAWARLQGTHDADQKIVMTNFWSAELPAETTLVYMFGVSRDEKRLERKMQHEANRLARPLVLMTYGPSLPARKHQKKYRGHHLYKFAPLHSS